MKRALGLLAATGYVAAVVAANVVTSHFGMVPVLPGLMVTAGTYAAGAALGLRDLVQDTWGKRGVLAVIAIGSTLSFLLADPFIAAASLLAFLVSETADFAVYTPLRHRGWARAVIVSNLVGGVLDSVVFLWIAPFPLTGRLLVGQVIGKVLWATVVPVLLVVLVRSMRQRRTA